MNDIVQVTYTNHRGETALRTIRPIRIWFGATCFHPEPGWMLECFDIDRMQTRDYAMSGIKGDWQVAPNGNG